MNPFKEIDEEQMEAPIVKEDISNDDFYKFSMGRFIHQNYRDTDITFGFTNRTKGVRLAEHVSEEDFQKEFEHFRKNAKPARTTLHYLRGTYEYGVKMFDEEYLGFLERDLEIPEVLYSQTCEGDIDLVSRGKWNNVTHVEIPTLKIVNTLYLRSLMKNMSRLERQAIYAEGVRRLHDKIRAVKESGFDATFSEFGNRRAAGPGWHSYVTKTLAEELPDIFIGPSKVSLAQETNTVPVGTNAHEIWMALAALSFDGSRDSLENMTIKLLEDWWGMYGHGLSIVLPDTFGSDFVFKTMTDQMFRDWKGVRQDSGDVYEFGEKFINCLKRAGANPREKLIIFSDGLSFYEAIEIWQYFKGMVKTSYGIGTNLTNDLGLQTLQIVMKAIEANGNSTIKLSDDLGKNVGPEAEIGRYKNAVGHANVFGKVLA